MLRQLDRLSEDKRRLALNNEKKATAAGKMETVLKEKSSSETYLADTQQECLEKAADFETASAERTEEVKTLVERFDIEPYSDLQPNEQTLEGSFSSVSTPNFASKYSLESS